MIKLHLVLQLAVNSRTTPFITNKKKTKKNKQTEKRLIYPLPLSIVEDIIRHNIPQMTSTSKAYISCPLAITIKWCQMKDKDRCQHQWWSLYIYIYWRDVMKTIKSAHPPHFPFFRCFFHIKWNFNFQVKIQTTQQQQDKSKLKKLNLIIDSCLQRWHS